MSRTIRILLAGVIAIAAVGGYWKLALAPKRDEAARLEREVAVQTAQLAQTQSLIATYQGAQKDYKANYETMVRLGKAVPTDDDTRSLVVQLDTSAKRSGIDFDTINLNASGSSEATSTAPGAINAGAFSALPFTLSFTGRFATLGNFFSRLESFVTVDGDRINVRGRLMRVESLSLALDADGWPGLQATVGASAYIVPKTAEPAATPAPDSASTPPTTTAAVSGGVNAG